MLFQGHFKNGLKKGDKVALISSSNRTRWNIMDIGVCKPVHRQANYPTISEQDYSIFLNHSEACYCFVSDKITIKLIQSEIKLPHLKDVFILISLQIVKIGQNY
jgi:long-chain acyl-CoA synthetase